MKLTNFGNSLRNVAAIVCNILLVYAVCTICRICFLAVNSSLFANVTLTHTLYLLRVGLIFDSPAILYANILLIVMFLFPLHFKERGGYYKVAHWLYVVVNALCIVINLGDCVYFQYSGRRTTFDVFDEFANEGATQMAKIFAGQMLASWPLLLVFIVLVWMLWKGFRAPSLAKGGKHKQTLRDYFGYYATQLIALLLATALSIGLIRGGFGAAVRPITISNANQYVDRPAEAAVVLNSVFSIVRTIGKKGFQDPAYFSREELDAIYSPIHCNLTEGMDVSATRKFPLVSKSKNVVILIVESFGREYIGAYNERLEGGNYQGYTPFVDSLYEHCLSFDYTFSNGRKSIDGMPSILSSIPMFLEPFFLTSASMNKVSSIAGELSKAGYTSAFFHGARNGSMGFQAFARATGFASYYGRDEYDDDARFDGDKDYDGTWAIWDEPFMQYYALKMSEMEEPFVTALFTASSHHPYAIPQQYKDTFPEEGTNPMHKCIRYTDMALRRFFETAKRQPWYENTIFVLTSDHTNISDHDEYQTDLGVYGAPILFFDPSGEIPSGRRHCIAQQIDIMPSLLSHLGYTAPYVAFGKDLFSTPDSATWAVNYNNGIYQYIEDGYLLQYDGSSVRALYNIDSDWMLQHDLHFGEAEEAARLERKLKAVIQSYMDRMVNDKLTVE